MVHHNIAALCFAIRLLHGRAPLLPGPHLFSRFPNAKTCQFIVAFTSSCLLHKATQTRTFLYPIKCKGPVERVLAICDRLCPLPAAAGKEMGDHDTQAERCRPRGRLDEQRKQLRDGPGIGGSVPGPGGQYRCTAYLGNEPTGGAEGQPGVQPAQASVWWGPTAEAAAPGATRAAGGAGQCRWGQ